MSSAQAKPQMNQRPKRSKRVSFPAIIRRWCPKCKRVMVLDVKQNVAELKRGGCPGCNGQLVPLRRPRRSSAPAPRPKPQPQAQRTRSKSLVRKLATSTRAMNSAPMRSSGVNNAERRFLVSMLNPQTTLGSKPIKMKSDNVQLPRLAYKFDSVFTVTLPNSNETFKIKFNPAPTIIAEIWSPSDVVVTGVRSIVDGNYTYVLGSKIGQLGSLTDRNDFEPAEDWTRYRCLGYSAQSMWVGREIDKSGTCYVARQNEEVDSLEVFNPTLKQDSIYTQAWKTISVTGQHKKPVYDFQFAESADSVEDTNTVHEREILVPYPISYDNDDGYTGFQLRTVGAGSNLTYAQWISFNANNTTCRTTASQDTFVKFLTELSAAYDVIQTRTNGSVSIDVETDYFFQIEATTLGAPKLISTTGNLNLDVTSANLPTLAVDIWARFITTITAGAFLDTPTAGTTLLATATISFKIRVPRNFKRTQTNIFTRNITAAIRADELDGLFTDSTFAEPILQFNMPGAGLAGNGAWQFIHTTNYELVVTDDSALGNFALAEKETPINSVNIMQNGPVQQILQSLPPAVVFDGGELDSTAKTELASRGILTTLTSVLGPVAAAMFPGVAPFLSPINSLASALDTSLHI